MKTSLFLLIFCSLLYHKTVAQTIAGPSTATVGQTLDYSLNTGTIYSNEVWSIIGGTKITQNRVGTTYTVTVNWTSAGTGKVTFLSNYVQIAYKNVTVTGCSAPSAPSTTLSATSGSCGPKTLSYSGSPPSGVSWYWQTSSSGTSLSYPTTYPASASGTYYLRAKANCGSVWSSTSLSLNVTVNPYPAVPSLPSVSSNTCGDKTLTRSTSPSGITWYWQGTSSTGTSTTSSNTTYIASASGTYYLRAQDNSTSCWSTTSAGVSITVTSPGPPFCSSDKLNWTETTNYSTNGSGTGVAISLSHEYVDGIGGILQTQAKNFAENQVLAAQPIKDHYGNPAITTLPAPINSSTFGYKYKFVSNPLNQPYGPEDFDKPVNNGAAGEAYNPNSVVSGGIGTLGWYYSSANTIEPKTPTTSYPYSRTYVPEGPNPTISTSVGPGDVYKMGGGHEVVTEKQKFTKSELSHYYALKTYFVEPNLFENNLMSNPDASSLTGFSPNQNVTLSQVTQNGETYVKAITNQSTSTPGIWPIGGSISVTPGASYTFKVKGYRSSSNNVYLYVRASTNGSSIVWPGALLPQGAASEGWVQSAFTVPAGITTVTVGILFSSPVVGTSFYLNSLILSPSVDNSLAGYKVITTNPDGKKAAAFVDMAGNALASATLTGSTYDNWSYTYYNDIGQVVATVAPNGVNTASQNYPTFVTSYKYDHLGRLIETTAPDDGTTQYVYSLDGKIRFSQNQEQRNASPKRFSYTNYDKLGRLIEAGEYTMSGTGFYVFETISLSAPVTNSVLNIADNIGYTGITKKSDPNNRSSDYSYIEYDVQATDLPGGDALHATQKYTYGQVSKTENAIAKTWYCYDDLGQLSWSKQYINDLATYKTVDYTYDFTGYVTEVAYQKSTSPSTDDFYHYYMYDADQRLSEVQTSIDGTNKVSRAKYFYYLHGPLKRIELMDGATKVQGIDYVYTINGALKGINHADNARDPGSDGDDIFGETIAYYDNDYTGAGYSAGTQTFSSYTNQYSGAIKGVSWRSPADNQMNKNAYAFAYDPLSQFSNADFGTMTGTSAYSFAAQTNVQKETIGSYDKNGNINSLQRRGKSANLTGDYSYVYTANTNQLDKINNSGSLLVDYTYNAIGQMTQQVEGSNTMNVAYNAYGLVRNVKNGSNQLMEEYFYDDQGNRFITKLYNSGTLVKTVYYIHDAPGNVLAIYEKTGATTTLIEVPVYAAGRVATFKPPVNTYFYEVDDHLGNVRAVIGSPGTDTYRATMESENSILEEPTTGFFKNITPRRVTFVGANVTTNYTNSLGTPVTGNEVARVNNTAPAGPGISLKVTPGDKLSAEIWAYYESGSSYNTMISVSTMVTAIAGAFGGVSGAPGESGQIYNAINSGVSTYIGSGTETTLPAAYLEYIVYDANLNPTGQKGFFRVTTASNMAKAKITMPQITIEQPGYIYIFVYNRSNSTNWVYFDEMLITHEHSKVVAGADYYPFGMVMDGRKIDDEEYRWGYQGQYSEKNDSTGWNEFELRMYDARFARWLSPDPYGQFASPYVGMGNNPVSLTDLDGGCAGIDCISAATIALADAAACTATRIGSTIGTIIGGAAIELNFKAPKIEPSFDAAYQEYSFSGTFEQYQERYPHFKGMTASEANQHWQDFHRDDFFKEWATKVKYERGQIAVQKMAWFAFGYSTAGAIGLGALGGSSLPSARTFGYIPRFQGTSTSESVWGYYGFEGSTVKYVGISNNPQVRFNVHWRSSTPRANLYYEAQIRFNSRLEARMWEQQNINNFGLKNLLNQRNEIRPSLWPQYNIK
jgi:RHS repeat-associated protein